VSILGPLPIALLISNLGIAFVDGISSLLMALFISLFFQELFMRFLFQDENQILSRRLGNSETLMKFSSMTAPIIVAICVFFIPFILSVILLIAIHFSTPFISTFSILELGLIWFSLGLLLDPLTSAIIELDLSESATVCLGYLSIVLVGIGAIPLASDGIIFQFLLCLALLNVRAAFMLEFGYKHQTSLAAFAPSVVALFIAMIPNLTLLIDRL
jgi:hypothetical protein